MNLQPTFLTPSRFVELKAAFYISCEACRFLRTGTRTPDSAGRGG